MICPNDNTVMIGGRIHVASSMGSFPNLTWVSEQDFQRAGGVKRFLTFKNKKTAYLQDVANEGYYCPTCGKIVAIFNSH